MKKLDPLELFLWTFRRNEKDVVNLYDALSDVMKIATGGNMLNFGYWDMKTNSPIEAQKNLCKIFGKMAGLESTKHVVDVGSGFGAPALQWHQEYPQLDISSININFSQLKNSSKFPNASKEEYQDNDKTQYFNFINSTATLLPFENESIDCVLSLEAAQHFKPLKNFFSESFRILKKNGKFALAIPVMEKKSKSPIMKLGILSMTWSSEHYEVDNVKSLLSQEGFRILESKKIGSDVYEPLATYYFNNRDSLRKRIVKKYPSYVEKILYKSLIKMKSVSQNKTIEYLLLVCEKSNKFGE